MPGVVELLTDCIHVAGSGYALEVMREHLERV